MSEGTKYVGGGGFFTTLWLVSTGILWVHPASFPIWVFDICNIIFWIGIIGIVILALILLAVIIVCVAVN